MMKGDGGRNTVVVGSAHHATRCLDRQATGL